MTKTPDELISKILDVEERANKRAKYQCTTGNSDLDKAISFYLKIGFEDGARAVGEPLAAALREAIESLESCQKYEEGLWASEGLESVHSILQSAVGEE